MRTVISVLLVANALIACQPAQDGDNNSTANAYAPAVLSTGIQLSFDAHKNTQAHSREFWTTEAETTLLACATTVPNIRVTRADVRRGSLSGDLHTPSQNTKKHLNTFSTCLRETIELKRKENG